MTAFQKADWKVCGRVETTALHWVDRMVDTLVDRMVDSKADSLVEKRGRLKAA